MENIERPAEVTKAQAQIMTEKNQQKYDQDQFEKIYDYLDELNGETSGNIKQVTVTQVQASGTEIAKINVDGTETSIYTPSQPAQLIKTQQLSGTVSWADYSSASKNIGSISVPSGYSYIGILFKSTNNSNASGAWVVNNSQVWIGGGSSGAGGSATVYVTALFIKN